MKAALLIVLSLSAVALAGPAFNTNNKNTNNQYETTYKQQQQQQQQQQTYSTYGDSNTKQTPIVETLKQWCYSSQMSQPELTSSFKKLVSMIKSSPIEQSTEAAVMSERICQGAQRTGASNQKSASTGQTDAQEQVDAHAHELIKDVYMDALISCKSAQCTEQLLKIIQSNKVDTIRASYYMTRMAVADKNSVKDEQEVKQFVESFVQSAGREQSESIERQKMLAATSLVGKLIKQKDESAQQVPRDIKQLAEQLIKTLVERYVKTVSQSDIQQYQQQQQQQQQTDEQLVKKIAKRNAALKALANIPSWMIAESQADETLIEVCQNKQELSTVRQSAIECLEQSDKALETLKQIAFEQEEPTEVRVAAYRALMNVAYAPGSSQQQQKQQQVAEQILDKVVKHCSEERNQQEDEQFVLYVVSHLDNVRTSKQPEMAAIRECISKNKQHYMQIRVLSNKLKEQLADVRKSSRNYKLEQSFQQLDTGLILEGDLIYESQNKLDSTNTQTIQLPKLVRVNMSMPVMGETVNVVEVTIRQNQMDEELLGALKLVQKGSMNKEGVSKVVDSFKQSIGGKQQQQRGAAAEADLTVKIDGCTVLYLCNADFQSQVESQTRNSRQPRSAGYGMSIVEEVIEHLKRHPVAFNRGFNMNINERIAKLLDVEANVIAGLRFESRASGVASQEYTVEAQIEPRFSFEAILGASSQKVSEKKLLQRVSTKSAIGMRLRYKKDELVDVQVDLPMNTMELFSFETQLVQKNTQLAKSSSYGKSYDYDYNSYTYTPESIYGEEDIYSAPLYKRMMSAEDEESFVEMFKQRLSKRSVFDSKSKSKSYFGKKASSWLSSRSNTFVHSYESSEEFAQVSGLRAKLRIAASPRDMSLLVKCLVQKSEPQMQGFRVRVHKQAGRSGAEQQVEVVVSTPGSSIDRTTKVLVSKQSSPQRTVVRGEVASQMGVSRGYAATLELVHDGRQYSAKCELVAKRSGERHLAEVGVLRGQSGRVASSYKPYVSIESSYLSRPMQLQGVISYAQSPKSVISYELKCPTTGDFVQGKVILESRKSQSAYGKRSMGGSYNRAMQSPLEAALSQDVTLTAELLAQVQQHAVKAHQMFEWECAKMSLKGDSSVAYKNTRRPAEEKQVKVTMQVDPEQQVIVAERKCPQQARKNVRVQLASDFRSPNGHQMSCEARFEGRRSNQAIVAYKHKIEYTKIGQNKYDCKAQVELVNTERQLDEKMQARARIALDRSNKQVEAEISSRNKLAKLDLDFTSAKQHSLTCIVKTNSLLHKHEQRADSRKFALEARTEYKNQLVQKCLVEYVKQNEGECKVVVEIPKQSIYVAAELKNQSGRPSSIAVQTPRFAAKSEFTFDSNNNKSYGKRMNMWNPLKTNYKFKSDLKDLARQDAYWLDSALNYADEDKQSFFRFESPMYRTEFEFEPRSQLAKYALAARAKRSVNQFESMYSNKESLLDQFDYLTSKHLSPLSNKVNLGNKMWMLRSAISGAASPVEQLKKEARRALFEFADRRQAHKQSLEWNPSEDRLSYEMEHKPNTYYTSEESMEPMRMFGELSPSWTRPARLSMSSSPLEFEMEARPFDGEQSFAKLVASSRHRRSPFKRHESEIRYSKHHGYKGQVKHEDSEEKEHKIRFEADEKPSKWAKMSYENEKHGKIDGEYNWRKHVTKRARDNEQVYANKVAFSRRSPRYNSEHAFEWDEPVQMVRSIESRRQRRSIQDAAHAIYGQDGIQFGRYSPIEYLKHVDARLGSSSQRLGSNKLEAANYKLNFDYQPQLGNARFNYQMDDDLVHTSSLDYKPAERTYKLASKLYNARTNEHVYDFVAGTKQQIVDKLATADQEPVFVHEQHQILEQPITQSLYSNIFKQPIKVEYNDKYGRIASFDYDHSPLVVSQQVAQFAGLRPKRAAFYAKDESNDFEHSSTYDFYPESHFGRVKSAYKSKPLAADMTFKTSTKYGPVAVRVDTSDDRNIECEIVSPIVRGKMLVEAPKSASSYTRLVKIELDNKQQTVELSKIVRKTPVLNECEIAKQLARKFDQSRFEQTTQIVFNLVHSIVKVKSTLKQHERQVFVLEGEFNKPENKAYAKINGERVDGELVADLMNKSANLVLNVDNKRTLQHVSRIVKLDDKFYSIESMTSHESKPVFKLAGKISSMVFEEPSHLFTSGRNGNSYNEPHISTIEAVLYEPKEIYITAVYDCLKKEARVQCKDVTEGKTQETIVKYDEQSDNVYVEARLSSPMGQEYVSKGKINLPTLIKAEKCHQRPEACQSELVYSNKSGFYSTKIVPSKYVAINTPTYKKTFGLAY